MSPNAIIRASVLLLLALNACEDDAPLGLEDVKSELKATLSVAAEAQLLAQYASQGRATVPYRRGHAEYMRRELRDIDTKLKKGASNPAARRVIDGLRKRIPRLRAELEALGGEPSASSLEETRKRLQTLSSDLHALRGAR